MQQLLDVGTKPVIVLLFISDAQSWKKDETRLIAEYRLKNPNLLNRHKGGEGHDSFPYFSEICRKCGTHKKKKSRGTWFCPYCAAKISGRWYHSLSPQAKEELLKKVRARGQTEKRKEYECRRNLGPVRRERDRRRRYARKFGFGRPEADFIINLAESLLSS